MLDVEWGASLALLWRKANARNDPPVMGAVRWATLGKIKKRLFLQYFFRKTFAVKQYARGF